MSQSDVPPGYRQRSLFEPLSETGHQPASRARPEPLAAPPPATAPPTGSYGESAAVRRRVVDTFYQASSPLGWIEETALLRALRAAHDVEIHAGSLATIVSHIAELVRLPSGSYASVVGKEKSPLVRYIRRLLAVCPGGLPVDIVLIQLARRLAAFAAIDEVDLLAFAEAHPELRSNGSRICPATGFALRIDDELGENERRVHEAIRDAGKPLTADEVARGTRHRARVPPTALKLVLRESVVLVSCPNGTYDALRPATGLYDRMRESPHP